MRVIKEIGKLRHRSVFQMISIRKNCSLKKGHEKMTRIKKTQAKKETHLTKDNIIKWKI